MSSLANFVGVAIDQDTCISCGACIQACPHSALEFDENMKARLIWENCRDDFSCIESCPVNCIYKVSEAPEELKTEKAGWYRLGRELSEEEKKAFEEWRQKYGVKVDPVQA